MGELEIIVMIEPGTGRRCSMPERDRERWETAGYVLEETPSAAREGEAEEAEVSSPPREGSPAVAATQGGNGGTLSVDSRAFEQPDRKPKPKRRRRKAR